MEAKEYQNRIRELQTEIDALASAVRNLTTSQADVMRITAGPDRVDGSATIRAMNGGSEVILTIDEEDAKQAGRVRIEDLKPGVEIEVLPEGGVRRILPKALHVERPRPQVDRLVTWNEIGGLQDQINTIRAAVESPIRNAKLHEAYGLTPLKGVLLYGPAGCGKTLIAKAVASTFLEGELARDGAFIYMKGPEILDPYIGTAEQRVATMFRNAREYHAESGSRAVLFIDEADAILPHRGSRRSSDVDRTIVPMFLAEMDGFDEDGNPFVILATNLPGAIAPEILREERIDLRLEIPRPSRDGTEEIFGIHLSKVKTKGDANATAKAGADAVFDGPLAAVVTGAMVKSIVKQATLAALQRDTAANRKRPTGVQESDVLETVERITHMRRQHHVYQETA